MVRLKAAENRDFMIPVVQKVMAKIKWRVRRISAWNQVEIGRRGVNDCVAGMVRAELGLEIKERVHFRYGIF